MLISDTLRLAQAIAADRAVDLEEAFLSIREAILAAAHEQFPKSEVHVTIDRETGAVNATADGFPIQPDDLFCANRAVNAAVDAAEARVLAAHHSAAYSRMRPLIGQIFTIRRSENADVRIWQVVRLYGNDPFPPFSGELDSENADVRIELAAELTQCTWVAGRCRMTFSSAGQSLPVKMLIARLAPDSLMQFHSWARIPGIRSKVSVSVASGDPADAILDIAPIVSEVVADLGGERVDVVRWHASKIDAAREAMRPGVPVNIYPHSLTGRLAALFADPSERERAAGVKGRNRALAARLIGMDIDLYLVDDYAAAIDLAGHRLASLGLPATWASEGVLSGDDLESVETEIPYDADVAKVWVNPYADGRYVG